MDNEKIEGTVVYSEEEILAMVKDIFEEFDGDTFFDDNPAVIENWKRQVDEQASKMVTRGPAVQSYWETDIVIEKAPMIALEQIRVIIVDKVATKLSILMNKYKHMEWLAYLVGNRLEDGTTIVEDIVIPKQRVTSTNVFVGAGVDVETIGVIHSHHDMGNFFSHTDDEFINQNHDVSLCITHKNITGQVRVKINDNTFALAQADVVIVEDGGIKDFFKEIDDNISIIRFTPAVKQVVPVHHTNSVRQTSEGFVPMSNVSGTRSILTETNLYNRYIKSEGDKINLEELIDLSVALELYNQPERLALHIETVDDTGYSDEYQTLIEEIDSFGDDWKPFEKKALIRLKNNIDEVIDRLAS